MQAHQGQVRSRTRTILANIDPFVQPVLDMPPGRPLGGFLRIAAAFTWACWSAVSVWQYLSIPDIIATTVEPSYNYYKNEINVVSGNSSVPFGSTYVKGFNRTSACNDAIGYAWSFKQKPGVLCPAAPGVPCGFGLDVFSNTFLRPTQGIPVLSMRACTRRCFEF